MRSIASCSLFPNGTAECFTLVFLFALLVVVFVVCLLGVLWFGLFVGCLACFVLFVVVCLCCWLLGNLRRLRPRLLLPTGSSRPDQVVFALYPLFYLVIRFA